MISVSIMCIAAPCFIGYLYFLRSVEQSVCCDIRYIFVFVLFKTWIDIMTSHDFWASLGIRTQHLLSATFYPVFLTVILFSGPMLENFLHWSSGTLVYHLSHFCFFSKQWCFTYPHNLKNSQLDCRLFWVLLVLHFFLFQ